MGRIELPDKRRDEDEHGYRDGEEPRYAPCACGFVLRADRPDLIREHERSHTVEVPR